MLPHGIEDFVLKLVGKMYGHAAVKSQAKRVVAVHVRSVHVVLL
jgi:hypothetical protein